MKTDTQRVEAGRTASYRMEDLDSSAELARLRAQVRLLARMEVPALRNAGLRTDATLLDIGCGPGFFAELAARDLVPDGRVIGVDVDGALLDIGERAALAAGSPIEYRLGSAIEIPLPDASVDFAYARFLFQHLDSPGEALAEMRRVTRPGGLVMVMDTDDAGLLLHPEPAGFRDLVEAGAKAQAARGGDRFVGRRLKRLLLDAGLLEVTGGARILTADDIGPEAFLGIAVGYKAAVIGPPWLTEERVAEALAALEEVARRPDFFAHALGYGAWGRVP